MPEEKSNSFWKDFLQFIIISALIIIPIRTWVAQPFIVRGASMEPAFHDGEYLIIDELSYHFRNPERGEVIVFRFPEDPSKFFIKRIIGLPGETIEIRDNKIFLVDGSAQKEIGEPYLSEPLTTPSVTVALGRDEYFMMGDNRLFSSDSRKWGPLSRDLVVGRVLVRLWPPARLEAMPGLYEFNF